MKRHTKEECIEAAKKCLTKQEFKTRFRNLHAAALHNHWYDECTLHMPKQSQMLYPDAQSIISKIQINQYKYYSDLPAGLIAKAKKYGILNEVKGLVYVGVREEKKYRKKPPQQRPNTLEEWNKLLNPYGLNANKVQNKETIKSDSFSRKYNLITISCNKYFKNSKEPHPPTKRRVTNIERDLKTGKVNCVYCLKPHYVSPRGTINHLQDCIRLEKNLEKWGEINNIKLAPNQIFNSSKKKYVFIDNLTQEQKLISASNILYGKIKNPFTRAIRLHEKFKITYEELFERCSKKGFKLITNKKEFQTITKYEKNRNISPAQLKVKFEYNKNIYESPITQIIKDAWYPRDYFISEEVVRFAIQKYFYNKFAFIKTKPVTLINFGGSRLELDGYCDNVFGHKVAFEHQGRQHYNEHFAGKKLSNIKVNDQVKKNWCRENNVILIEIRELGHTDKILELPTIFEKAFKNNNIKFNKKQCCNDISLDEINNYLKNKIPKRLSALRKKLESKNIEVIFNGINKAMAPMVQLIYPDSTSKKMRLSKAEAL